MFKVIRNTLARIISVACLLTSIAYQMFDLLDIEYGLFELFGYLLLFSLVAVVFYELAESRCKCCGKPLWPLHLDASVCPYCDASLKASNEVAWTFDGDEDGWTCQHCGTKNKKIYGQCKSCGKYRTK